MAPLIPDIIMDEQGQPMRHTSAQTMEHDILVGGSTLSPAGSILIQDVMQRKAQASHAGQALHTIATRATDAVHLLRPQPLAAFQWQKATTPRVHADLRTVHTRFQKMGTARAGENARFQWFQQALWTALPLIESRWKEETVRAQRLASASQLLIDSRWKEAQERLQTLRASLKAIHERICEALHLPFQPEGLRAQKTLQELAAPSQALFQAWQARMQPFLEQMTAIQVRLALLKDNPKFQEEVQRTSDIFTLLRACCPRYRKSDPAHQQEDAINTAVMRLIAQLHPGLRNPRAAHALRQRAAAQHISPQDFLRIVGFPAALRLVAREVPSPRRMRLGREWVTDRHGKIRVASPGQLRVQDFNHWFFSQVYAAAAASVLDEAYPRPTTQQAQMRVYQEEALERLTAPASPGTYDSAMLTALLQAEERDPADQLHRVLTIASPREKELLLLLCQGLSRDEAAQAMGIKRNTADVLMYRVRQKSRRR